jgi:endonuclease/exonuclease/phosphatase (EEP) superfamily protein YafD
MPAIEMEIRRDEKEESLSLLAVHTVSPDAGDGSRTTFRDEQLKVLGNWAADRKNAAMIIGDLNVTPWSPPFWRLLEQGRLVDSSWYRGYFPSWPTVLQQAGIPIDHALVNAKIQVLDRRNVYHRSNSDHYPILITIQ